MSCRDYGFNLFDLHNLMRFLFNCLYCLLKFFSISIVTETFILWLSCVFLCVRRWYITLLCLEEGNKYIFIVFGFNAYSSLCLMQTRFCSCSENLESMLDISRKGKQLSKASCGSCGGKPLVDGIEPEPAMLGAVDLELTNFINSDLTWNKVKKGCRSTNRRSRKTITPSMIVGSELGKVSRKREQDSSVLESEKVCYTVVVYFFTIVFKLYSGT